MSKWIKTSQYEGECRRSGNGLSKLIWTVMVSACGVIFVGLMAWMTSMNAHISSVEAATNARAERIAALETVVQAVDNRLDRMESKLDDLMSRFNVKHR